MSDKYIWEPGADPPSIEIHSTKKHEMLRNYLEQYIKVLGGRNPLTKQLTLTLIDGFSGGGVYKGLDGGLHYGSPIIFLKASESATIEISLVKDFTLDSHYIFVDENEQYLEYLKSVLIQEGYGSKIQSSIQLVPGTFESNLEKIIEYIKKRKGRANRCIFLLDQYGYSAVKLSTLQRIFKELPKAEVILTFAVDSLIDYLGDTYNIQNILSNIGISYNLAKLQEDKSQKEWRTFIQHEVYRDFLSGSGASFLTNFFVKSTETHRSYWLLHLSMHMTARNEMLKIHWELKNHFQHEGKHGLQMLAYRPEYDEVHTNQKSFVFSDIDKEINDRLIYGELPNYLSDNYDMIKNIYERFCNSSTGTLEMFIDVLEKLHSDRQIIAKSENGSHKRLGSQLKPTDLVARSRQLIFFFE